MSPIGLGDATEIERGIVTFAREPNRGLIVAGGSFGACSSRADHHACGAAPVAGVHPDRVFVDGGGLMLVMRNDNHWTVC